MIENKYIANILKQNLETMKGLKFFETIKISFVKQLDAEKTTQKTAFFNSKVKTIISENDIDTTINNSNEEILIQISTLLSQGSGWNIEKIDSHYLNIVEYKPTSGSSYISLPKELQNSSKGLINIKNTDNECFRWCHIRYLNPQEKDSQRIKKSDRKLIETLNYKNIQFPINIKDVNKIEIITILE